MIVYNPQTALIVVDMQNDFADPAGSLYVTGGEELIEPINGEVDRALEAGSLVVYTQDWHPEATPHFSKDGGIWPVHCVGGTWGSRLHPKLRVRGPVVRKGVGGEDGYSGFSTRDPTTGSRSETALGEILDERSIERVVVVGLALDYCVKATALDAIAAGFPTTVGIDMTRAVELEPGDTDRTLAELLDAEAVTSRLLA